MDPKSDPKQAAEQIAAEARKRVDERLARMRANWKKVEADQYAVGKDGDAIIHSDDALRLKYRSPRELFEKEIPEIPISTLYRNASIAHFFSEAVAAEFGFPSLQLLIQYEGQRRGGVPPGDPGDFEIEVPGADGQPATKKFRDCSVNDMRKAVKVKKTQPNRTHHPDPAPQPQADPQPTPPTEWRKPLFRIGESVVVLTVGGVLERVIHFWLIDLICLVAFAVLVASAYQLRWWFDSMARQGFIALGQKLLELVRTRALPWLRGVPMKKVALVAGVAGLAVGGAWFSLHARALLPHAQSRSAPVASEPASTIPTVPPRVAAVPTPPAQVESPPKQVAPISVPANAPPRRRPARPVARRDTVAPPKAPEPVVIPATPPAEGTHPWDDPKEQELQRLLKLERAHENGEE